MFEAEHRAAVRDHQGLQSLHSRVHTAVHVNAEAQNSNTSGTERPVLLWVRSTSSN